MLHALAFRFLGYSVLAAGTASPGRAGLGGGEMADQHGRMNGHVSGKRYVRILELILNMNHPLHELGHRIIHCPET